MWASPSVSSFLFIYLAFFCFVLSNRLLFLSVVWRQNSSSQKALGVQVGIIHVKWRPRCCAPRVTRRIDARNPRMLKHIGGTCSFGLVVGEHRQQEVCELDGFWRRPAVDVDQHFSDRQGSTHQVHVLQFSSLVVGEYAQRVLARHGDGERQRSEHLDHEHEMTCAKLVPLLHEVDWSACSGGGGSGFAMSKDVVQVEQVVAGGQLERHTRQAPHVDAGRVAGAEYDLWRAILGRLYFLTKVEMRPARIAQVDDLHLRPLLLFAVIIIIIGRLVCRFQIVLKFSIPKTHTKIA